LDTNVVADVVIVVIAAANANSNTPAAKTATFVVFPMPV
jgi:hypothetical protein